MGSQQENCKEYRKVVGDDASKNGDFETGKQRLQGVQKISDVLFYLQQALINDNNFPKF